MIPRCSKPRDEGGHNVSITTTGFRAAILAFLAFGAGAAVAERNEPPREEAILQTAAGTYAGPFGSNTITLQLDDVAPNRVRGYSQVGDNRRVFVGWAKVQDGIPQFEVRENGDHPEDGFFRFRFLRERQALVGTWTANNKKVADISFTLTRSAKAPEAAPQRGKAYSPVEGSKEYSAIVAAARAAYERRFGKRTKTEVRALTVQDGWAGTYMFFAGTHEDDFDLWLAVLRGSGGNWKVVEGFRSSDQTEENDPFDRLMRRKPAVPTAVIDALNVQ